MNGAKEMAKQTALSVICLFRVSEYPFKSGRRHQKPDTFVSGFFDV